MKRRKMAEVAGVLEFEGKAMDDPEITAWVADHKAQSGERLRLSQGGKGCRVAFSKEADLQFWTQRLEKSRKA
jgi:hypothetical protein